MVPKSYIVDLGLTAFKSKTDNPNGDKQYDHQKLYCLCGHSHEYMGKVSRDVIVYTSGSRQDPDSLKFITCSKCNRSYPDVETPHLLEPDKGKLIKISYSINESLVIIGK